MTSTAVTASVQEPAPARAGRSSGELSFLSAAITFAVLPLAYDLWFGSYLHFREAASYVGCVVVGLGALGFALRQPLRTVAMHVLLVTLAVVLVWAAPLSARERFAHDVSAIRAGMSREQVAVLMAEHVLVDLPVGGAFAAKTYYEAGGEHHIFDNYCLISWQGDRVAGTEFHED